MVTATLPPFARQGTRVDIVVSTLGDASNLMGGTLLVTPLVGADAEVYAVAQGTVAVSGFSAQGPGASGTRGVPTAGRIPNGATVEREVAFLELLHDGLELGDGGFEILDGGVHVSHRASARRLVSTADVHSPCTPARPAPG